MEVLNYKKAYKSLYLPKVKPEVIDVPEMTFFILSGQGNPNEADFASRVEALYALSYAVRMSYKSADVPEGYYDYTVFPLEGVWDLVDYTKGIEDKSNLSYQLMIRQPDFVNEALFERFKSEVLAKKKLAPVSDIGFQKISEGLCCQMMHIGSYDSEPESFMAMEAYVTANGYVRSEKTHREIYLSDPRKGSVDKQKTVIRFRIEKEV